MNSIGTEWTLVKGDDQRAASEARIYCDNGTQSFRCAYPSQPHWLNGSDAGKHFDKEGKGGGWIDTINRVRSSDKCEKGNMFTSTQRLAIPKGKPPQSKQRVTITICDKQFDEITKYKLDHRFEDVPADKDLTKSPLGIKQFNILTSMAIVHEVGKL